MRRKWQAKRSALGTDILPPSLAPDYDYSPSEDNVGVSGIVTDSPIILNNVPQLPYLKHARVHTFADSSPAPFAVDGTCSNLRCEQRSVMKAARGLCLLPKRPPQLTPV